MTDKRCFWHFDREYWFEKLHSSTHGLSSIEAENALKKGLHIPKNNSRKQKEIRLFLSQ